MPCRRRWLGPTPFRASAAIAEGLVIRGVLRSRRFVRLFPDVYVAADVERTHAVLAAAASVLLPGAVIIGVGALEVAGIPCARDDDPVEVTVPPGSRGVAVPGLRVRRRPVPAGMVPADPYPRLHPDVAAVDVAAETRLRLPLLACLLPTPVAQHRIRTRGGRKGRLDVAWPDVRFAVEHDGEHHLGKLPGQAGSTSCRSWAGGCSR